jgi:pimeloyl-ACP methyl ester carboxylesterase
LIDERRKNMTETPPPRRSWLRRCLRLFLMGGGCYLAVLLVLLAMEDQFLYPADTSRDNWTPPGGVAVQDLTVVSGDGTPIHCWWSAPPGWKPEQGALLFCHGNGGNLSHRGSQMARWQAKLNVGVLLFDYPGYGKSGGKPSEAGCYAAAEAAHDWLTRTRGVPPERVILYGGSLGGGVAIELATRHPPRALVTAAAFSSFPDMAQVKFPWLPGRYLVRNQYDNVHKIAALHCPVFIAHGTADRLVPFSQGEELYRAANEPKRFFVIEGGAHNESPGAGFDDAVRRFLDEHS